MLINLTSFDGWQRIDSRTIVNRAGFEIRLEGDSRKMPYAVFDPEGRQLGESATLFNLLQFVEAETAGRSIFEGAATSEPGAQPSLGNAIVKDTVTNTTWRPRWKLVIGILWAWAFLGLVEVGVARYFSS